MVRPSAAKMADGVFSQDPPFGRAETPERGFGRLGRICVPSPSQAGSSPNELDVGSGGNRILFCLQGSQAGIDLVHLPDGRMRLAVNEWPDRVKNDSSPGRLVVGKWTFFAVTYDATCEPGQRGLVFQRTCRFGPDSNARHPAWTGRITYNVGAVANRIGPLAIGNFNRTMQSYGWDRQFRGEIKGLKVFGSRIGRRGALDLKTLKTVQ